jgi:hypothetical protein
VSGMRQGPKRGCRAISSCCGLHNKIKDKDVMMQTAFSAHNTFTGPDFVIIVFIAYIVVKSMCCCSYIQTA